MKGLWFGIVVIGVGILLMLPNAFVSFVRLV